jgi:formyl-CoA transferase
VTLDLRTEGGRRLALRLVRESDVVLENFRPGTLERWGLGPAELAAANPEMVLVRISGYGQTGPYAARAGFGGVAEAFGGLRYVTGDPSGPPVRAATSIGDEVAGLYAVIGALMSMLSRARGGATAPMVDVALYEAVFSLMESLVPDFDAYGVVRERTGGSLPGVAPTGVYPCCAGQWVVIGGNANAIFGRLMRAIGRTDLAADPDLTDGRGRGLRSDELNAAIAAWTIGRSVAEVLDTLENVGVPAGPVHDASAIADDPHYLARDMLVTQQVEVEGLPQPVRFPGVVPKVPGAPGEMRWPGPELGEHTDEVLGDLLGVSADELLSLRTEGVIS